MKNDSSNTGYPSIQTPLFCLKRRDQPCGCLPCCNEMKWQGRTALASLNHNQGALHKVAATTQLQDKEPKGVSHCWGQSKLPWRLLQKTPSKTVEAVGRSCERSVPKLTVAYKDDSAQPTIPKVDAYADTEHLLRSQTLATEVQARTGRHHPELSLVV